MSGPATGYRHQSNTVEITTDSLRDLFLHDGNWRKAWFVFPGVTTVRCELKRSGPDTGAIWLDYDLGDQKVHQCISLIGPSVESGLCWLRCPVTDERVNTLYLPPGARQFASARAHKLIYDTIQ
jgi:hypothetical protein